MNKIIITIAIISFIRILNAQDVRSFDGTGNNISNPEWGSAYVQLLSTTSIDFGDGIKSLSGSERPNARLVSNFIANQSQRTYDELFLTQMSWVFEQFIDHDINQTETNISEPIMVKIPQDDEFFVSGSNMNFFRTKSAPGSGTSKTNPRKYLNKTSSFLDASNVYGTSKERSYKLRTFEGGKLKTSEGSFLPWNTFSGQYNDLVDKSLGIISDETLSSEKLYFSGDEKVNDNPLLISLHTIFLREHNRLCDVFKAQDPNLSDEALFQKAKKKLIALLQNIAYNEWLPELGIKLPDYNGYNPQINPGISNLFSAFKLESTLQSEEISRLDNEGNETKHDVLYLKNSYFKPLLIPVSGGIEPFLKGAITNNQEKFDLKIVDGARNFLYGNPNEGGLDIATINIMRSRERGLPNFNIIRKETGLEKYNDFSEMTSDKTLNNSLKFLYGNINNLDAWVGLLAEERTQNSIFGTTLLQILTDQFTRLRDGDRFYYENDDEFTDEEISEIKSTRMHDILIRNTGLKNLPANVFTTFNQDPGDPGLAHENLAAIAYPNPVQNTLKIKLWLEQEENVNITIINFSGQRIHNFNSKLQKGSNELQDVDMTFLPTGMYCVLLETERDYSVIKIIKNNK